eukprot:10904204-Lingulodinium_polyedra.AAC.1
MVVDACSMPCCDLARQVLPRRCALDEEWACTQRGADRGPVQLADHGLDTHEAATTPRKQK